MKKSILIFAAAMGLLSPMAARAADDCAARKTVPDGQLSLEAVVELGLCRNPSTAAAYLSVLAARHNKNAGYAPYLPSVDASASASKSWQGGGQGWSGVSLGASVSASYLIFDFGKRLTELNQLADVWRATGFDYDYAVQNYVYDVIAGYYGLLAAYADIESAKDLVKAATESKNTADKKFKAGAVAKADVLKAETLLANRQLDLQRAEGSHEIAKGRLLNLLSFEQSQDIQISDLPTAIGSDAEYKSIGELIEAAKKQRPDLMSASASKDAAWNRMAAAFLRRLPSISASGSASYNDNPAAVYANKDEHISATIGIRASMPLFAGFSHVYAQRAAEANYERAQEQERQKLDSVELDVWTAYQNYQTARKVLEQTGVLLKSAAESEKVTGGMYKVGRATMLDWLTQQAELASAKKQNIAAKYDLYVKRAALALSIGELKMETEGQGNP